MLQEFTEETELTVKQIEAMIEYAFSLRDTYHEAKEHSESLFAKLKDQQEKIQTSLEKLGLTSYKSKHGTVSYKYSSTYKTPKTPESREQFYAYFYRR